MIGQYKNGNYVLFIDDDGTKVRVSKDDTFIPERPEHMDVKITNMCDMGCPYCHEDSKPDGKHGDIMNDPFLNSVEEYTELAIGGGNPLSHPQLIPFLQKMKERNVICNMTVNQMHFLANLEGIRFLCDNGLIHGLGVSLVKVSNELLANIRMFPNAVIHVIAGVVDMRTLKKLYDNNIKLLFLGYKKIRRGLTNYNSTFETGVAIECNIHAVQDNLREIVRHFNVVSFDNLAIEQLDVKQLVAKQDFDAKQRVQEYDFDAYRKRYMGDDGEFSMFVDCVKRRFASSSISPVKHDYTTETAREMFRIIRKENGYV